MFIAFVDWVQKFVLGFFFITNPEVYHGYLPKDFTIQNEEKVKKVLEKLGPIPSCIYKNKRWYFCFERAGNEFKCISFVKSKGKVDNLKILNQDLSDDQKTSLRDSFGDFINSLRKESEGV
jgi:hypothetical protein